MLDVDDIIAMVHLHHMTSELLWIEQDSWYQQNRVIVLRGPCLGASQQPLCPLNIFLITCLHFSVFPSYEYSTALEFLHSTTNMCILTIWYLGSYSVSLRFSLRLWISGAHSILHLLNILSLRLWISDLSCIASWVIHCAIYILL